MIDWTTVFDEVSIKEFGADDDTINKLVRTVSEPLSHEEINRIYESQKNPWPKGHEFYESYQPIDPKNWMIPSESLPSSYLSLLRWSNGGEFWNSDRCIQLFPALDPSHGVRAMLIAYHVPEFLPGAIPFAFNGGGTFYLFDMRNPANNGEYPIICSHASNLGWANDEHAIVANSLESACRGTTDIDELP